MNVIIQKNLSEKNKVTKTIQNIVQLEGTLRKETDIINPVIQIQGNITQVINANYLTIPEFGREYFITDIKSVNAQLYEISAHCDVLASFRSEILANSGIIQKNEKLYNAYINDGFYTVEQGMQTFIKPFSGSLDNDNFILVVAGDT